MEPALFFSIFFFFFYMFISVSTLIEFILCILMRGREKKIKQSKMLQKTKHISTKMRNNGRWNRTWRFCDVLYSSGINFTIDWCHHQIWSTVWCKRLTSFSALIQIQFFGDLTDAVILLHSITFSEREEKPKIYINEKSKCKEKIYI